MPDTLFTLQALTTLGGVAMLTFMVVQKTKDLSWIKKIRSDLYAVFVGSVILLLSQFGIGASALDWKVYFLALANGFLVSYVSGKANDDAVNSKV